MANEVIHSMRKSKADGVVFKIDFSKAYNSINWECLRNVMEVLTFGNKWRLRIDSILKSSKISVPVNRSHTKV